MANMKRRLVTISDRMWGKVSVQAAVEGATKSALVRKAVERYLADTAEIRKEAIAQTRTVG